MYTILVASLNENMKLANTLKEQLIILGVESQIINLVELNLIMYSSKEEEKGIPHLVLDLVESLKTSQGYIVVAPEYNYTIPPVLSNVIAWVSRVEDDFKVCFNNKITLLCTHSGGNNGGGRDVLRDMRNQFTKLGSKVLKNDILITYQKQLDEQYSKQILTEFLAL